MPVNGIRKNVGGEEKAFLECPLCDQYVELKSSKKDKPYITCSDCGVQMFIRYHEGIERVKKIINK